MSTGTTLRLFKHDLKAVSNGNFYGQYLNSIKKFNSGFDFFLQKDDQKKELVYPRYLNISNHDEAPIWIYNKSNDDRTEPSSSDTIPVISVGSVSFPSDFTVLVDHWCLNQYDPKGTQHTLGDLEILQLGNVLEYLLSPLSKHKDAKDFEKIMFKNTPFFDLFSTAFPSREFPKEFQKDQSRELAEAEDCMIGNCKDILSFVNFVQTVSDQWENPGTDYRLVYFKW